MSDRERSRRRSMLAVVAVVAMGAGFWGLWTREEPPHDDLPAPNGSVLPPVDHVVASNMPAEREPVELRDDTAPASHTATHVPRFPFTLLAEARDEFGFPQLLLDVPFGPAGGAVSRYRSEVVWTAKGELFAWTARTHECEIVVGSSYLRCLTLRSGESCTVGLGGWVKEPVLADEEVGPPPTPDWDSESFRAGVAPEVVFAESREAGEWNTVVSYGLLAAPGTVQGRVTREDGTAAPDSGVWIRGATTRSVVTGPEGHYEIRQLPPGEYELVVGTRDGADAQARVTVTEGVAELDLQLQQGPSLRGRVVDATGAGVAGARLLLWNAQGAFDNLAFTAADGTFVVPRITRAPTSLWACVPGTTAELPAVGRAVVPGETLEFVLDYRVCRGSLRVHVAVPADLDPYQVTARLWQESSGLGVRLVPFHVEGESVVAFGRDAIPAGHYRLELFCPGLGLVTAGTHWIDGQSRLELRNEALPQPSRVTFVPAPGQPVPANDAFAIVRLGREVDSGLRTEVPFAGPHVLGQGRYAVFWRAGGDLREHAFEVGAVPGVLSIPLPR